MWAINGGLPSRARKRNCRRFLPSGECKFKSRGAHHYSHQFQNDVPHEEEQNQLRDNDGGCIPDAEPTVLCTASNMNLGLTNQYFQIDFTDLKLTKLCVDNIPLSLNTEGLKNSFRTYDPPIVDAVIYRSGRGSRGCGYIVTTSISQAQKLLNEGGPTVLNRKIGVHAFSPKGRSPAPPIMGPTAGNKFNKRQEKFFSMVVTLTECHIVQLFRLISDGQNTGI